MPYDALFNSHLDIPLFTVETENHIYFEVRDIKKSTKLKTFVLVSQN